MNLRSLGAELCLDSLPANRTPLHGTLKATEAAAVRPPTASSTVTTKRGEGDGDPAAIRLPARLEGTAKLTVRVRHALPEYFLGLIPSR